MLCLPERGLLRLMNEKCQLVEVNPHVGIKIKSNIQHTDYKTSLYLSREKDGLYKIPIL